MTDIKKRVFGVKKAGHHFGFFKRTGRHQKGTGLCALQKQPRQNTALDYVLPFLQCKTSLNSKRTTEMNRDTFILTFSMVSAAAESNERFNVDVAG